MVRVARLDVLMGICTTIHETEAAERASATVACQREATVEIDERHRTTWAPQHQDSVLDETAMAFNEVSSSELLLTCALNCSISSSNLFVSAACAMLICAATQCSAMRRLPHSRSRSEAPEQRTMAAEGKISGQRLDSTRPQHCTSPSGCLGNPPSGKAISAAHVLDKAAPAYEMAVGTASHAEALLHGLQANQTMFQTSTSD
eukprot:CAMPEP_0203894178 /NCGR_PEP_ID=MMETSP0359-20131031/37179_1 /ASSEMBLY_ACC=CAM_ASM_000338 /TAXON_ID=268821 /ORGANISM="Scrippsiella Hangoei, Strain SHTV-5" /LENGTH=202 /DNA_ID=CAMNT_0050816435 /DNA_START=276 /DNA_END=881 /DNA_ORIENTATION=+